MALCPEALIAGGGTRATVTLSYSDVWGNGRDLLNVTPGAGVISADPRFAGPGDLHLSAGSPAIDYAVYEGALGEFQYRRKGLAVSLVLVALVLLGLLLKIRQVDRDRKQSFQSACSAERPINRSSVTPHPAQSSFSPRCPDALEDDG